MQSKASEPSPFPGQRDPRSLDSIRASSMVTPALVDAFRQRLPVSHRPSFFLPEVDQEGVEGRGEEDDNQPRSSTTNPALINEKEVHRRLKSQYPICLFLNLPEQPPADTMKNLVDSGLKKFVQKMPFLRSPQSLLSVAKLPHHLSLALAAIGAIMSTPVDVEGLASNIWQTAVYVHSACAEVDNRHARRVDWIVSYCLIETFGVMHGGKSKRTWTNAWNGHADTASRRIGLHQLHNYFIDKTHDKTADKALSNKMIEHSSIMAFYFMMEFLRSLHFQLPTSFLPAELAIPLVSGISFRHAYRSLVLVENSQIDPANFHRDEALLLLVGILSDILSLQSKLGPLCSYKADKQLAARLQLVPTQLVAGLEPDGILNFKGGATGQDRDRFARSHADSTSRDSYFNPFLPTGGIAEYMEISRTLNAALDHWYRTFLRPNGGYAQHFDSSVTTLFHLGRLLISAGPRLLIVAREAGFGADDDLTVPASIDPKNIPLVTEALLQISWQILESLEEQQDASRGSKLTALWNPSSAFLAGLVAWLVIYGKAETMNGKLVSGARRLLRLLEMELHDMIWPCAASMATMLRDLRVKENKMVPGI